MGTRGKIVDVIHHLSPKVPIISLRYFTLDVEFILRYDARISPNIFATKQSMESSSIFQLTFLKANSFENKVRQPCGRYIAS